MKTYTHYEILNDSPPRLIISMNIYKTIFELGFNKHYSLDSNLTECLVDFFQSMKEDHPDYKIDVKRSKLEFRYVDLPE